MVQSKNIVWLNSISKKDTELFGENATRLAELAQSKIKIPSTFLVHSRVFERLASKIMPQIDIALTAVSKDDFYSIKTASEQIKQLIYGLEFSEELQSEILSAYKQLSNVHINAYAVSDKTKELISTGRDLPFVVISASSPMPKTNNTQANIKGISQLSNAIKLCWCAMFSVRAIFYRLKYGIRKINFTIIVQKMVNATKSGDLFTINPIGGDKKSMYIQAIFGILPKYMSNPTQLVVDKISKDVKRLVINNQQTYLARDSQSGEVIDKEIPPELSNSQILSKDELNSLVDISSAVQSTLNFPQYLTWAIERGEIFITSSKRITDVFKNPLPELDRTSQLSGQPLISQNFSGTIGSDVLVVQDTTDDLIQNMLSSSGILVENPCLTSHAAIISYEFNKPCVLGVKKATEMQDGSKVTVNESGSIYLETPQSEQSSDGPHRNFVSVRAPQPTYSPPQESYSSETENSSLSDLDEKFAEIEKKVTDLVYEDTQKRREGLNVEEGQAKFLSELEWKIREIRKKLSEL